jgi:hypothetical protein
MSTRDENAGDGPGPRGMRWPHGVTVAVGSLFVVDAGNNQYVLGQADATRLDHNRGASYPPAGAMNMPYGLCAQDDRLIVSDTANSRLLGFDLLDVRLDASASRLAGQPAFTREGDNRWAPVARDSLCWPYGVAACGSTVAIPDSGNNLVLPWAAAP